MTSRIKNPARHGSKVSWGSLVWFAAALFLFAIEGFAQDYELSMKPRRLGNQLGVEIWMKSLNSSTAALGNASIYVEYNTDYLTPAKLDGSEGTNPEDATDSINVDVDNVTNPHISITSNFKNNAIGYTSLTAQAVTATQGGTTVNVFGLDVNYNTGTGYVPSTEGRGSFVGMLRFNIDFDGPDGIASTADDFAGTELAMFDWNSETFAGDITLQDVSGNDIEANATLVAPDAFTIRGIEIWNPDGGNNQVVNRYPTTEYPVFDADNNLGYPIYFERSGLTTTSTEYGNAAGNIGYALDYSLDGGTTWTETARFAETSTDLATMGANTAHFFDGFVDYPSVAVDNYTTDADGVALAASHKGIIRTIWKADDNFPYRSENAKLKLTQLTNTSAVDIDTRSKLTGATQMNTSDDTFVLGRLFFAQLDGSTTYFKTRWPYSNASQLTVMAWVNLNGLVGTPGAEPGIIACSEGSKSDEEGAWLLYLEDGNRPAFRAREKEGRGTNGYLGSVVAPTVDALSTTSAAVPITDAHGDNWMHIAATVANGVTTLYINGEIVAQETNTSAVDPRLANFNQTIWVGVNPNGGITADDYLNAGIKDVSVWRIALSQDVLRSYIPGVYDPEGSVTALDNANVDYRTGLELYYPLQGSRLDLADDNLQFSDNNLDYFTNSNVDATSVNSAISYRPDRSHIRLTAPLGGEGISNLENQTFEVRWAAYGLGSTTSASEDLQIMVSRDGGTTWFDATDNAAPALPLDNVEVEAGEATWEPYNNITVSGADDDLQGVIDIEGNWSKPVKLRISGTESRAQNSIYDESGEFLVAPWFALQNNGNSKIEVPSNTELNLNASSQMIEAWVRPYRFPTVDEAYFPIMAKKSEDGANTHYSFRLLESGQLQLVLESSTGDALRTATSDATLPLVKPSVETKDSLWYHVAVYFNLANGGTSTVYFFIDGTIQSAEAITSQLGTNITIDNLNAYPSFIASEPVSATETKNFIGQIKEVRFWNGNPAGQSTIANITKFVQGAATVRANELVSFGGVDYTQNLAAAFVLNGGSFVNNGMIRTVAAYPASTGLYANVTGVDGTGAGDVEYNFTKPVLKLIEPIYKQAIPNSKTDLKVRWTGFDYNRNDLAEKFYTGADGGPESDLGFGTVGGGGTEILYYEPTASKDDNVTFTNAMSLTEINPEFEFQGSFPHKSQFAAALNVSITDPDANDDGTTDDQGPMGAAMTNGRLKLEGRSTVNGYVVEWDNDSDGMMHSLFAESQYFNITPPSNFTVRVIPEGYYSGGVAGAGDGALDLGANTDIGSSFDDGGFKISLYTDNAGVPGSLVATNVSTEGYLDADALDKTNQNAGTNTFGNVPFVFTDIEDGDYFVVVEHINHLPVMSKYSAHFQFSGDANSTWTLESGWDFSSWNGVADNTITAAEAATSPSTFGSKFTAYGNAETDDNKEEYSNTGLHFNEGQTTTTNDQVAVIVAGDVVKDYQINGLDRTAIRTQTLGAATTAQYDVTGDGYNNAIDRTIVDRNNGKVSSLTDVSTINLTAPRIKMNGGEIDNGMLAYFERTAKDHNPKTLKQSKMSDVVLAGLAYTVFAETEIQNDVVEVSMYIENNGGQWAMGNATYALDYNPVNLEFMELANNDEVIFANREDMGYASNYSAPQPNVKYPMAGVKSIEIDYDAYTQKSGQVVPNSRTYLGTLRFKVIKSTDVYAFDWHNSTAVLSTTGQNMNKYGDFRVIKPVIVQRDAKVLTPNGSEDWDAGALYTITWTKPNTNSQVNVEYTTDNGNTWNRISAAPLDVVSGSYNWKTPAVNSDECLVRLVDAKTNIEIDRSDAPFSIISAPAEITRPTTTDPIYRGGANDFIRWSVNEASKVRFEFSSNGVDSWQSISATVNSTLGQVEWIVPSVNSKNAVVRMIETETNEVLAVSKPFKVLAGAVTMATPSGVKEHEVTSIKWSADNVSKFDLQLSIDGGKTWGVVATNVAALKNVYQWTPNLSTNNEKVAVLRAVYNNDNELEYDRTDLFAIDFRESVAGFEAQGYLFNQPVPNPFREEAKLSFTLPATENVTMTVYNAVGNKVATLINGNLMTSGDHEVTLSGHNLPAGVYVVRLTAGAFTMLREVVLVK